MRLQTYEEQQARKREWMEQITRFKRDYLDPAEPEAFIYYLASYITERTRDIAEIEREEQNATRL